MIPGFLKPSKAKFTVFVISVTTKVLSFEMVYKVANKLKNPHPVTLAECLFTIQNYYFILNNILIS